MCTIIQSLYQETNDIITSLTSNAEVSLSLDAKRHFTKIFILSIASYFEDVIQKIIFSFVENASDENEYLVNFVKKKAILFQYHTYFSWGEKGKPDKPGKNANAFFGLFGESFKLKMKEKINSNDELNEAVQCFIEIGHMRNILVHSNFASYNNISKTIDELYAMYKKALLFVDLFKVNLTFK